jgi:hypothetical protein
MSNKMTLDEWEEYLNSPPIDWRKYADLDPDPDDEELDKTPPDVVELLGFDPKEFSKA